MDVDYLETLFKKILESGKRVVVVAPRGNLNLDPWRVGSYYPDVQMTFVHFRNIQVWDNAVDRLKTYRKFTYVVPDDFSFETSTPGISEDGMPEYWDSSHLTRIGADNLFRVLSKFL